MRSHELYENIDFLQMSVPFVDQLTQLAEECCELAQTALKLRRAVIPTGTPTPINAEIAEQKFHEEIADVLVCLMVTDRILAVPVAKPYIDETVCKKAERWVQRIKEKEGAGT